MLKKVLSSEALKVTDKTSWEIQRQKSHSLLDAQSKSSLTTQSSHGLSLLQKLVDEQASKFIANSEEVLHLFKFYRFMIDHIHTTLGIK